MEYGIFPKFGCLRKLTQNVLPNPNIMCDICSSLLVIFVLFFETLMVNIRTVDCLPHKYLGNLPLKSIFSYTMTN